MPVYRITPYDVLFFRDARPFEAGGGHGARWPEPNIMFDALHAALHRAFPGAPAEWENQHLMGTSGEIRDKRFGSLQSAGPFPILRDQWLFPRPQDYMGDGILAPLKTAAGVSDLSACLKYPLGNTALPSKEEIAPWWSKKAMEAYLGAQSVPSAGLVEVREIYASEWTTGIGIDSDTQTQDGERLYSAEYLRLGKDAHMGLIATMLQDDQSEGIAHLFSDNKTIIVGGQQRACSVEQQNISISDVLPFGPTITRDRIKWVLLTPTVFPAIPENTGKGVKAHPGGWLPSWVDHETGKVKLLHGGVGKNKARRMRLPTGKELDVHLVAARIPKPIAISGWSERLHTEGVRGATPTVLAVPAGAVYYFEGPDAAKLAELLNWHGKETQNAQRIVNRRSTLWGEQGFGIGVCGTWDFGPSMDDEMDL
jgi:CRISPR-associated protein Cmr3